MRKQSISLTILLTYGLLSTAAHAAQGTVQGTNVFINSGGIEANHIAQDAINTGKVIDGSLRGNDLADDTLFSDKIGANAIGASELGNASVDTLAVQEGAVTTSKLADNAVNTGKIADGTILGADIANGTVTGSNIANGSITSSNIANGSVGNDQLSSALQLQIQKFEGFENDIDRGDSMSMAMNAIPHLAGKKHSFGIGSASVGDSESVSFGYKFQNQSNFAASIGAAFSEGDKAVSGGVAWGF